MKISRRIINTSTLKESDTVYLVSKDGSEPEAFVVVATFPGRCTAWPVGKSLTTGMNRVLRTQGPGEQFYIIEEREEAAS